MAAPKGLLKKMEMSDELSSLFLEGLTAKEISSTITASGASDLKKGEVARTDATKLVWIYIKKNDLQDNDDKRIIHPDDLMQPVFGKKPFSMMQIARFLGENLS